MEFSLSSALLLAVQHDFDNHSLLLFEKFGFRARIQKVSERSEDSPPYPPNIPYTPTTPPRVDTHKSDLLGTKDSRTFLAEPQAEPLTEPRIFLIDDLDVLGLVSGESWIGVSSQT